MCTGGPASVHRGGQGHFTCTELECYRRLSPNGVQKETLGLGEPRVRTHYLCPLIYKAYVHYFPCHYGNGPNNNILEERGLFWPMVSEGLQPITLVETWQRERPSLSVCVHMTA